MASGPVWVGPEDPVPAGVGTKVYPDISSIQDPRCEKGYLSLIPLAFAPVPPDVTASKLIASTRCLEINLGIRVNKFMVLFW